MDEQTKGFRSAVFGGFRREDVLRYIEETDARYYEESERLRSGLDDAQTAMGELRGQNEKLTEKNAELLERLGAMTLDMDRIQAQLDEIDHHDCFSKGNSCGGRSTPRDDYQRQTRPPCRP